VFIVLNVVFIISLIVLIFVLAPRYGSTNVLIYTLMCSILGSFTVMSVKGVTLGIKEIFITRKPTASYAFTALFVVLLAVFLILQVIYLNKSLDIFSTPVVTTVYYVLFTTLVLIASAILFKEFHKMPFMDIIGLLCGFVTIICSLYLIRFINSSNPSTQDSSLPPPPPPNLNNLTDDVEKRKSSTSIIGAKLKDSVAPEIAPSQLHTTII
jgi:hypothetical protein